MTESIRVLVADDHPIVRNGIAQMVNLADGMTVVAEATTGLDAVQQFREVQPDVTLMDLRMPDMSGVEAITTIRQDFPDARIAILTTYDTDEDIFLGLQAGAKGYLLKDTEIDDLLDAIRTIHRGNKYIPPAVGAKLAERMGLPPLSEREREVIQLMAEGKTNQEISEQLHLSESTVKFHISNIFKKLGVSDRTQAVLVALKRGITNL
ncbi:two component transcriptional family [Leptolyngbya sp. Heron Island J]|uniref:response regulator n=1 Tax=Leptolyngbya sp. Heron Island J TaxID=1385935 RepID=UPI0003B9E6FA|nr:response regulator transcription factor [Leptolyngbya sp. Heron Island J]ESA37902.1 two component transcriptional family [Leptolyngbya sp. Heron Island J]